MLSILANHNPDIRSLIEKGYAVSLDSNCLVVRDIPYLDTEKNLHIGAIVSKLVFTDQVHVQLEDHQIFFCGSHPCELNGTPIANLGGGPVGLSLISEDLVVQRSFSNKPPSGFANLFDKIESYATIFSGPATELHGVTPFTFREVEEAEDSVFKYRDTLTSRAELGEFAAKLKDDVIAIIGLGGTGAYVLDFLVKTPVKEIRGFDGDFFHVHTAFRSPGRMEPEELSKHKAEVYQERYEKFRHGLKLQPQLILADSVEELTGITFAFICVDRGPARAEIVDLLIRLDIPFIDVGMGLDKDSGLISGTLRTSYFPNESAQELMAKDFLPLTDIPNDVYQNNIQISELNALNAALAVMKYKQIRGFYASSGNLTQSLFTIDNLSLLHE